MVGLRKSMQYHTINTSDDKQQVVDPVPRATATATSIVNNSTAYAAVPKEEEEATEPSHV